MANASNKTGRTISDLVVEFPKTTLGIILTLLLLLGYSIYNNYSINLGFAQLKSQSKTLVDTSIVHDTIFKELPQISQSKRGQVQHSKIEVQTKDTLVKVDNPQANVNVGGKQTVVQENNGIIGDNTVVNVHGQQQRQLSEGQKIHLKRLVNEIISKNRCEKNCPIQVTTIPDSEARTYALEILNYLKIQNYNVISSLGTYQSSPEVIGVEIGFEKNSIKIWVGYPTK